MTPARPGELTCQELVEIVTEYLEGAMTDVERMRFEEHLAICDGCSNYLGQMRTTMELTGTLREEHIPSPAKERLLQAFRDWSSRRP